MTFSIEKTLTSAAHHCDDIRVRELPNKPNHGPWIKKYLETCGLPEGNPWCAAFVTYHLGEGGFAGPWPQSKARVSAWLSMAEREGLLASTPQRGDLFCWVNPDGTGHMGFITRVSALFIWTIEGNTDGAGSREGDGVYRDKRLRTSKMRFIRLS